MCIRDRYSIADIATWPWARGYERRGHDISEQPNVLRWINEIAERPGTKRGLEILKDNQTRPGKPDKETLENYFGDKQYQRR